MAFPRTGLDVYGLVYIGREVNGQRKSIGNCKISLIENGASEAKPQIHWQEISWVVDKNLSDVHHREVPLSFCAIAVHFVHTPPPLNNRRTHEPCRNPFVAQNLR
jgi:hypothetical protein